MKTLMRSAVVGLMLAGMPGFGAAWALPAPAGQSGTDYKKLIESHAPAIVSIKFVLEAGGEFGGGEQEMDASGVMIERDGLVLVSNSNFGGMFAAMMGGGASLQPKNIRVMVGDDTKGVEATLIARDSELDLAWVRINEPDAAGYAAVDFSRSEEAGMGSPMVALSRMGKFFDRAPVITRATVGGVTTKPRALLVPDTFFMSFGTPVFSEGGAPIGLTVLQTPSAEEMEADMGGMGGMGGMDSFRGLVLPAAEIVAATKRAKETAGSHDAAPAAPESPSGEPK